MRYQQAPPSDDEVREFVGSGLLVDARTVLTADHVAQGFGHRCSGPGWDLPVVRVVRTAESRVDLAVLELADSVAGVEPLSFARLDRSRVAEVADCVAVGFPRWKKTDVRYTAQVTGTVPTGENLTAHTDARSAERYGLLTLIGDRAPGAPAIPTGLNVLADRPGSMWGGMSGAAVVAGGLVLGVVRAHNFAEGGASLSVTPITAIDDLPSAVASALWTALGVTHPATLPTLPPFAEGEAADGAVVVRVPRRIVELRGRAARPDFTGRDTELARMHTLLTAEPPTPLVLTGLGGVGKSQLAVEYATRHGRELNLVWTVRGDNPAVLAADLAQLATELDLHEADIRDIDVKLGAVRRWLTTNPGWLLLIDNVDNSASKRETRRLLPAAFRGRILVTSRLTRWPAHYRRLFLAPLNKEDSATYLLTSGQHSRTNRLAAVEPVHGVAAGAGHEDIGEQAAAQGVADKLGGLPLALAQAAAYCATRAVTLRRYSQLLDDARHSARLLAAAADDDDEDTETVATTWAITIDQVRRDNPTAGVLLDLLAYFAPDAIPRFLFLTDEAESNSAQHEDNPLSAETERPEHARSLGDPLALLEGLDDFDIDEALAVLHSYSLAQLTPQTITLHRLVQTVVRASHNPTDRDALVRAAASVVEEALPNLSHDHWPVYQGLLPHALATAKHVAAVPNDTTTAHNLLALAGAYQRDSGQFGAAQGTHRRLLAIIEALPQPKPDRLIEGLNILATTLMASGQPGGAHPLAHRALAIAERDFGADHPEALLPLSNLGAVLSQLGR
ncbi:Tetratricopeptide repeat-containing protein, partial [Geodermatophilus obscurus]